jgi:hypothetical protein
MNKIQYSVIVNLLFMYNAFVREENVIMKRK